jgi:hypothetical protein
LSEKLAAGHQTVIKSTVAMKMIGNVELEQIATTIERMLKKVFDVII